MKPCTQNRKSIALLAMNELDAQQARKLRAHILGCDGCRCYLDEISRVSRNLRTAELGTNARASEAFHQRVVSALRAERSRSFLDTFGEIVRRGALNWRVAVPAVAIIGLILAALLMNPSVPRQEPYREQAVSVPPVTIDLSPSIANYRMAASRSWEDFDDLLTRQAKKNLPPGPIYTASILHCADPSWQ